MNKVLPFLSILCVVLWTGCQKPGSDANDDIANETVDWRKMDGPERFQAYHQLIRTRADLAVPEYRSGDLRRAYEDAVSRINPNKRNSPLPWIERGPGNVGGRTRGLWVAPNDTTLMTVYAGSAGGGIWKTTDGGSTWQNLTEDIPNLATTTIAGSSANPQVLYAGTGEGFGASRNIVGQGLLKSTNAGQTWEPISATANLDQIAVVYRIVANPENENEFVFSSLIHPRAPLGDSISHIVKSEDGGETIRTTYASGRAIQQLVAHPNSFRTLYAVVNGGGVLKSTNAGDSWNSLFAIDTFRRMELAVSPSATDVMYLAGERRVEEDVNSSVLLCSPNGGQNWYRVMHDRDPEDFGDWFQGQGWYNNSIAVHPYDSQTVYVGGAGPILKISLSEFDTLNQEYLAEMEPLTDGYGNYREGYSDASSKGVHVDHHNLLLVPSDPATKSFHIYNANDGGVAISTDNGETFLQTGASFSEECADPSCRELRRFPYATGYNTSQFYGVDKANGQDRYVGGTQDNGSWVSGGNPGPESEWLRAPGGDGFEAIWHYHDTQKLIETAQFNTMIRSDDGGETWRLLSPPGEGPFLTRLAGSRQEPDLIFSVTEQGLIRSLNFGDDWETITMPDVWKFQGLATPVRVSLANPNIVWSGAGLSNSSGVVVSRNRGTVFDPIETYDQAVLGVMTNLATHPSQDSTAYFLFSQANGPKVIRTTDLGNTLEDISGFDDNSLSSDNGYPDAATYSLLVMPYDENILWAGTEIGLFESTDNGASWHYADNGLPPASIWDMKIVNDQIILATHGRGVWTVTLPELEGYEPKEVTFLSPGVDVRDYAFDGAIRGMLQLNSGYDSSIVDLAYVMDGDTLEERLPIDGNDAPGEVALSYDLPVEFGDTMIPVEVVLRSFQEGVYLDDRSTVLAFSVNDEPTNDYYNDFDLGIRDFARHQFVIEQPAGFDNISLNTHHPYRGNDQYVAVFQRPVVVGEEETELVFDEIVLVEPGDSEPFPSSEFFDYCLIDATADRGATWQVLAGYDSRDQHEWLDAYDENPFQRNPDLAIQRQLDLSEIFNPGDTVFIRFSLISDPFVEGWGWQIDNFGIGEMTTSTTAFSDEDIEMRILGNPSSTLNLEIRSDQLLSGTLSIISLNGQRVYEQPFSGVRNERIEGPGAELAPGMYLVVIQTDNFGKTLKWLKQ